MESVFRVDRLLDDCRFRPIHFKIVLILAAVMLVDGYDLFVAGALVPAISAAWHVKPSDLTGVFVCQQAGLLTGVLVTGPLADRVGRKTVLVGCLTGFGAISIWVAMAHSPRELMALRFLSAIFFSGALPNCVAYVAEIAPKRIRAGLISVVFCGYTAGQFVCASVLAFLLGTYDWQGGFYLGAALPLLLVPILVFFLPESPRFLAQRDDRNPQLRTLLQKFDPALQFAGDERFSISEGGDRKQPTVRASILFRGPLLKITILVWAIYFLAFTSNQMLQNWDTTIVHHVANIPYQRVALMLAWRTAFGVVGMATAGFVMDRVGADRALAAFFTLGGLVLACLAHADLSSTTGFLLYIFSGYALNSALSAINAHAAIVYPSSARVTGVAWASGFGRIGGMLGPVIGGVLLSGHPTTRLLYWVTAAPDLLCGLIAAAMIWSHHNKKRRAADVALSANPEAV
jgi:AAHS family 4-hydroxybenzoate transporter-like MFS transporter